jgi:hypothetical protein
VAADGSGRRVCGAKTRNPSAKGPYCQQPPVNGCKRCRMHGGKSPRGAAHYKFTNGMYSKHLPLDLVKLYRQAEKDPELLSAKSVVALLETRLITVLEKLKGHQTGSAWGDLQAAWSELGAAMRSGDVDLLKEAHAAMGKAIRKGADEELVWDEVRELVKEKMDAQGREWKRQVDLRQLITAERAESLVQAIMHSVLRHVTDPVARSAISHDVIALTVQRPKNVQPIRDGRDEGAPEAGPD